MAGAGLQPPAPRTWEHYAGLGWGHSHITGSKSDWSKGFPQVGSRKLMFPPSRPSFPSSPPCHSILSTPSTPAPPPPWQGPLNLNHVSIGISPSCPGPAVVTAAFRLKSGLVGLGETVSYFGLIRSIQTSGPVLQCPWLAPHPLGSLAHSGFYLPLCLAWLSPWEEPHLSFSKSYLSPGRNPVFPLCPAICSHSLSLLPLPSLPVCTSLSPFSP